MSLPRRVLVAGLGLMGGSLARALASRDVEVWGVDRDPDTRSAARAAGVVRTELPPGRWEGVELLVLAVPVSAAPTVLAELLPRLPARCLVTDLGSTKGSLLRAAEHLGVAERTVGSHPLTGDHRAGWEASRADLYRGARVFLCPAPTTRADTVHRVHELWRELEAHPELRDAGEHDQLLAWSSHLPQIVASALGDALAGAGVSRAQLGPGGRDATRLAASSPEMWTAICMDNAEHILPALDALAERLALVRSALRDADAERIHHLLAAAQAWAHPDRPA